MNTATLMQEPLRNAIVKTAFSAWLGLGNRSPSDWSGAGGDIRECLKFARGGFSRLDLGLVAGVNEPYCSEIYTYSRIISSLGVGRGVGGEIEELCQMSYLGNPRAQRILAGLLFSSCDDSVDVPGLDESRKITEGIEFFLEDNNIPMAAKILARGGWWGRCASLCAGRVLLDRGLTLQAKEAFKIGAGLGETGCAGYNVAIGEGGEKIDSEKFRAVQLAAERGFALPLKVAARALMDGTGIDEDPLLASLYEVLTDYTADGVRNGDCDGKEREVGSDFLEVIFSWAGKHPNDPIFLGAAKIWSNALVRRSK